MLHCCLLALLALGQFNASNTGELRVSVSDQTGLPVAAVVTIASDANQFHRSLRANVQGAVVARQIPFGTYEIHVNQEGFLPFTGHVEVRSAAPTTFSVMLELAGISSHVSVTAGETLLNARETAATSRVGRETIEGRTLAPPGRALPDLISTQPGWLLEANGVLHPRGSEYQTQYVVDGLPLTDNRSPSFAPEIDADAVESMAILTGGFPAEYGRKLGGIIEVNTLEDGNAGLHGSFSGSAGSFATRGLDATAQYGADRTSLVATAGASATDRYLDPPGEENFSNHGVSAHASLRAERSLGSGDRVGAILRVGHARFLVPNERTQEEAGQRQTRASDETVGQFSEQHIGRSAIVDVRAMTRSLSAVLSSNPLSTPIVVAQDRGIGETYIRATIAGQRGSHEWKAGGDVDVSRVREQFSFAITNASMFAPDTPSAFHFAARAPDHEQSAFMQDRVSLRNWTINAGVRVDHYAFLVHDSAVSPRIAAAWSNAARALVVRASYDRAFQTPSFENLLLASSQSVETLSDNVMRLPVPPSRGDFYEAGIAKGFAGAFRVDVGSYVRRIADFADDDVLLNTGVTFPIAFRKAVIRGTEAKLNVPAWHGLSGFVSYANMTGVGCLPIRGGLLLGENNDALDATDRFVITQDQRNTAAARAMYQRRAVSLSLSAAYGSGLPVEFDGSREEAVERFGDRLAARVDFERGRVRPALTLDASAAVSIGTAKRLRIQADVLNLANTLRVINFAGVFSGTAVAPPRSLAVRVKTEF